MPTANKPKLHRGDEVTVCVGDWTGRIFGIRRARIVRRRGERVRVRALANRIGPRLVRGERIATLFMRDEGIDWARGWDTPEALALQAEIALLVSK